MVADKGYHSNDVLTDLTALEMRSYINEPDRGRRNWCGKPRQQQAVYGNRRRISCHGYWNAVLLTYMRPAGCGGRTCAATKIS